MEAGNIRLMWHISVLSTKSGIIIQCSYFRKADTIFFIRNNIFILLLVYFEFAPRIVRTQALAASEYLLRGDFFLWRDLEGKLKMNGGLNSRNQTKTV